MMNPTDKDAPLISQSSDFSAPQANLEVLRNTTSQFTAPEDASSDAATANPLPTYALTFTGRGGEYFRIWIVNLLLTIITLGIYYPWAKARRLRYFHNHTVLDGHNFDFHGDPFKMLKGFVLMAVLFITYNAAGQFNAIANLIAYVAIALIAPLLLQSAFRFRARNTSWRGMRFAFSGSIKDAYKVAWPFMAVGLVPAILYLFLGMPDEMRPENAGVFALVILGIFGIYFVFLPWLFWRVKLYQNNHYHYAQENSQLTIGSGSIYAIFIKAMVLMFAVPFAAILVFMIGFGILALVLWGTGFSLQELVNASTVEEAVSILGVSSMFIIVALVIIFYFGMIFISLSVFPYITSRLQNLVWSNTYSQHLQFKSNLRFRPLLWLSLKNWFLILFTLGLYSPFAQIALAKMRLSAVQITPHKSFDEFIANTQSVEQSAIGDAGTDLFDFDIGL